MTWALDLFQEPFQIIVTGLEDTLKGGVMALKLAKLSNVLFMQLPNFTTESINRNLFP